MQHKPRFKQKFNLTINSQSPYMDYTNNKYNILDKGQNTDNRQLFHISSSPFRPLINADLNSPRCISVALSPIKEKPRTLKAQITQSAKQLNKHISKHPKSLIIPKSQQKGTLNNFSKSTKFMKRPIMVECRKRMNFGGSDYISRKNLFLSSSYTEAKSSLKTRKQPRVPLQSIQESDIELCGKRIEKCIVKEGEYGGKRVCCNTSNSFQGKFASGVYNNNNENNKKLDDENDKENYWGEMVHIKKRENQGESKQMLGKRKVFGGNLHYIERDKELTSKRFRM